MHADPADRAQAARGGATSAPAPAHPTSTDPKRGRGRPPKPKPSPVLHDELGDGDAASKGGDAASKGIQRTFPQELPSLPSQAKSCEGKRTRSAHALAPRSPHGAVRRSKDAEGAGAKSFGGSSNGASLQRGNDAAESGMEIEETDERGRQLDGREADESGRNGVASAMAAGGKGADPGNREKEEQQRMDVGLDEGQWAEREGKRALGRPYKKRKKKPLFTKRRKIEGSVGFLPGEEDGASVETKGDTALTEAEAADASQWMLCEDLTSNCTYIGKIVAYGSNGMVLVHYKGWKTKDREWVPRDRLSAIPPENSGAQPGKLGRSHWPESSDSSLKKGGGKGKSKNDEEDTYAEPKVALEELLEHMCYECGEDGPLVFCKRCNRHFHPDCVGEGYRGSQGCRRHVDASRNPICPTVTYFTRDGKKDGPGTTVAGGAAEGATSQWTCRLCIKMDRELSACGRQGCARAVPRLLQLCDRFPMKHPYAAFGRQLVRIYEFAAKLQDAGKDANEIARMLHAQGAAGKDVPGIVLERLTAAAKEAGLSLTTSTTDGPSAGTVVGALALRQHGGNDDLHCDVCGYNKVEVGCTTCAAVFHLRCLNLWLEEDEDMPRDWRCCICLHEAKERGAIRHECKLADSPSAHDVDGDASGSSASGSSSSMARFAAHRRSSGAVAKSGGKDKVLRLDGVLVCSPTY